jgi:hypothetical protein
VKKVILAGVFISLASPVVAGDMSSATYRQIENEIGCTSKATDAKKDVIFDQKYRDRWVVWTGKVHDVKGSQLWLNDLGSHSIGSDFDVDMNSGIDLLQFDKDQTVTVKFRIKNYMGCILPLRGTDGTVVSGRGQ